MRRLLACSAPGCSGAWYQFGPDHARAVRRAIQRGWTGSGRGTACLCGQTAHYCPEHRA
jgi:hypothetical protein